MVLPIIMAVIGVSLIVIATARFGFSIYKSAFSPSGLMMLGGIGLFTAAILIGVIQSDRNNDRAQFDSALVKMFGRLPDRLDLEGKDLMTFKGIAYYDGKRYQLKMECDSLNDKASHYAIIATPMDATPPGK